MAVMIPTGKMIFLGQIETTMQKTLYTTSCSVPVCCVGKGPKTYLAEDIQSLYHIIYTIVRECPRTCFAAPATYWSN